MSKKNNLSKVVTSITISSEFEGVAVVTVVDTVYFKDFQKGCDSHYDYKSNSDHDVYISIDEANELMLGQEVRITLEPVG